MESNKFKKSNPALDFISSFQTGAEAAGNAPSPAASPAPAAPEKRTESPVVRRRLSHIGKKDMPTAAEGDSVGRIISVSSLKVEVLLSKPVRHKDILICQCGGRTYRFEVAQLDGSLAVTVPFDQVNGLRRGVEVTLQ